MLVEIPHSLYNELEQFYSDCWHLNQLDGQRMPLVNLLERIEKAWNTVPTVILPGPDGEPNVELPLADEDQGDW